MKFICAILFLTFHFALMGQDLRAVAVVNGQYEGSITKITLIKSNHVEIYPKIKNYKISRFNIYTNNNGEIIETQICNSKFDEKVNNRINNLCQGDDFYIKDIIVINSRTGDTSCINSIHFVIGQDAKKYKKTSCRLSFIPKDCKHDIVLSKEQLLLVDNFVLTNSKIIVISFVLEYYFNGIKQKIFNSSDKFSTETKQKLEKELRNGSRLIIKDIIGTDKSNTKYFIAPEIIRIK